VVIKVSLSRFLLSQENPETFPLVTVIFIIMQRSKLPLFFLGLSAVIALSAIILLVSRPAVNRKLMESVAADATSSAPAPLAKTPDATPPVAEEPLPTMESLAPALGVSDPAQLVSEIGKALEIGDVSKVARLIGKDALTPESLAKLLALAGKPLRLVPEKGIREVGELELNQRSRWILSLAGEAGWPTRSCWTSRILGENGRLSVSIYSPGQGILPGGRGFRIL
jgi:hypothetical protein